MQADISSKRRDRFSLGLAIAALLVALSTSAAAPMLPLVGIIARMSDGGGAGPLTPSPWLVWSVGAGMCVLALTVVLVRGWAPRKAAGVIAIVGLVTVLAGAAVGAIIWPKLADLAAQMK